jgi:chromosome segregation ATPase
MKKLKSLGDIANLHDLRMIPRTRRSAKPQLATTAILSLNMARNERDHLVKEKMRLVKRKTQIDRRLTELDSEMDDLLKQANKKAAEIRGEKEVPMEINAKKQGHGRPRTVVEY